MQKSTITTSIKYVIFTLFLTIFSFHSSHAQNLRISGSNSHSVIICSNGNVFAWGNNNVGQIGVMADNVTPYPAASYDTPQRVYGLSEIYQIDAGSGSHTLGLTCNGEVLAWGANEYGQLGDGNDGPGLFSALPVQVLGVGGVGLLNGVSFVSGGNDESFAILATGEVVAWGQNDRGQLGDGTTIDRAYPDYVINGLTGLPLQNVVAVEAGDENGYALLADGTVWSWGDGIDNAGCSSALLQNGGPAIQNTALPVHEDGAGTQLSGVTQISAGDRHLLAIKADGTVWGGGGDWGSGQVGNGDGYYCPGNGTNSVTQVLAGEYTIDHAASTYLGDDPTDPIIEISAGQAHSMAVSASGRIYTWGSDEFFNCGPSCSVPAGQLGVGGVNTVGQDNGAHTQPMMAGTGAGSPFTNVIGVSDGDGWTFVLTDDGNVWAAGYNGEGQLGDGNGGANADYFVNITIPSCGITSPCPDPNLGVDIELCNGFTWTLSAGLVYPDFTVEWYLDGALQSTENVTGVPKEVTFDATSHGTWEVRIIDNRPPTDRPCSPCPDGIDQIAISLPAAPFSDPGTNEYCGTDVTTANVTGTGSYEWYAASAAGSVLANSTASGNIDASIPLSSLTQLSATQYEVWVEDVSSFATTVGPTADLSGWGRDGGGAANSWLEFTATQALTIDFVDVYAYNNWNGSFPITVELQDNTGAMIQSVTTPPLVGTANTTQHTVALGLSVPGPGTYRLAYVAGAGQLHYDGNSHPIGNWPYNDPAGVISITNNYDGGSITPNNYSYFYNWQVTTGTLYPCGRLQVLLNENCPPCAPPTSVSIDQADPTDLCVGDNQILTGTYALGTPTDQYYYTWLKDGTPVAAASTTYADLALTGVATTDGANYTLRIEDGNNSNSVCYLEDDIDVNVYVVPDITVVDPAAVCTPSTVNITTTWTDNNTSGGTVTYHTGPVPTGGNVASSPTTISNSGTYYVYIDNNGCTDIEPIDVTVNTTPDLTITDPASACSPSTVDITGTWVDNNSTTPTITYHSATPAAPGNAITNQAAIPSSGTYYILADNATCTDEAPVIVTIDPATAITTNPSNSTVCDGDNASFTVLASGSGTLSYQWYLGATPVGTDNATLSLTGVSSADAGNYTVEVTGSCGSITSSVATLTVNPPTTITVHPTDVGVCAGSNASFSVTAAGTGVLSYQWYRDVTPVGTNNATLSLTGVSAGDAGDYTVEVTGGCGSITSNIAVFTITSTEFPAVTLSQPADICEGSTATFTATVGGGGGSTPTFTFYDASGPTVVQSNSTTATYTTPALTADMDVYVEMTSNSTCIDPGATNPATSSTITVTVDAAPSIANIIETDFNTCSNATSLTNDPITSGAAVWSSSAGSVNATSGTTANVNSLPVGTTTVTLTVNSALGLCSSTTDNVDITVLSNLTAPDAGENDTICETEADPLLVGNTPVGIETGNWFAVGPAGITTGGQTSGLQLGENKFYYTMDNGSCSDSDTVSVFVDETPGNVGITTTPIVTCDVNVSLTAQVPAPGTGTWSNISGPGSPTISAADLNNPSATISNLSAGITSIDWTVTNGKCVATPVTQQVDKQGSTTPVQLLLNGGGFVNEDVTNGFEELCISDAYTITANTPNTGAGESGIWSRVTGTSISIVEDATESQSLTLNTAGLTTLRWSISSSIPGCIANTGDISLNVNDAPSPITPTLNDIDVCGSSGSMVPAGASSPAVGTGTWSVVTGNISSDFPSTNPGQTFTNLSGVANMRWTVSTGGVCPDVSDDITVTETVPLVPSVTLTPSDNPACFGLTNVTYTANATGVTSPTFEFIVNGVSQQNTTSSVYNSSTVQDGHIVEVIVTSTSTCSIGQTASAQTSITVEFTPSPTIGVPDYDICQGDGTSLTLFSSGGSIQWYSYISGSGITTEAPTPVLPLNGLNETKTFYAVEDNGVCPAVNSDSVTITVNQTPTVTLGGPYQLFADETVVLDGSVSPASSTITWSDPTDLSDPNSTDPTFFGSDANAGVNTMVLTADNNGCINSASTIITVLKPIKIPNAFTPNGDLLNDSWEIEGLETYPNATLEVFNRWGSPVYKDVGTIDWWTGYRGGEAMPVATYYYILDLGIADDESDRYQGSVTLVK